MQLYGSYTSPYVRRVRVVVASLGLVSQIEYVQASPYDSPQLLLDVNPLSRIPTLITGSQQIIPDSALICDYLCAEHHGEAVLPLTGALRWQILQLATLAEGVIDCALDIVMLRKRAIDDPEKLARQTAAIARTLQYLSEQDWSLSTDKPTLYELTLGCALGYLAFRLPDIFDALTPPDFLQWFVVFDALPVMQDTRPRDS